MKSEDPFCPDCDQGMTRRDFGKAVAVVAGTAPLLSGPLAATSRYNPDTPVARFYGTLTAEQRKVICFPFDHNGQQVRQIHV